jgi:hypothetical protein
MGKWVLGIFALLIGLPTVMYYLMVLGSVIGQLTTWLGFQLPSYVNIFFGVVALYYLIAAIKYLRRRLIPASAMTDDRTS